MCYSGVWLKKHLRPWKGYSSLESYCTAAIAQLGERQTEDLKVAGLIPACGIPIMPFARDTPDHIFW